MPLDPYQIGQFTDYLFDCSRGNDLVIDKEKLAVYYQQEEITVSQPEYHLLLLLMENKWKTVT